MELSQGQFYSVLCTDTATFTNKIFKSSSKTHLQKDFPEMYEPKRENPVQTVDRYDRYGQLIQPYPGAKAKPTVDRYGQVIRPYKKPGASTEKETSIQTVDQMIRRHEKPTVDQYGQKIRPYEKPSNNNPRFVAGTVQAINQYVTDRQGFPNSTVHLF